MGPWEVQGSSGRTVARRIASLTIVNGYALLLSSARIHPSGCHPGRRRDGARLIIAKREFTRDVKLLAGEIDQRSQSKSASQNLSLLARTGSREAGHFPEV